jgi:hypothetical protein
MSDSSTDETLLEVPESDLGDVYSLLYDATNAAASGDPNRCASLASDAKERMSEIHAAADVIDAGKQCPECGELFDPERDRTELNLGKPEYCSLACQLMSERRDA